MRPWQWWKDCVEEDLGISGILNREEMASHEETQGDIGKMATGLNGLE